MTDLSQSYFVLSVETQEDGGMFYTSWLPIDRVDAVSGAEAIKKVAKQLGDGAAVAIPAEAITVRATRVERRTRTKMAEVSTALLAPELEPEPEEAEDVA